MATVTASHTALAAVSPAASIKSQVDMMVETSLQAKAERLADRIASSNFKQSDLDFSGEARLAEAIATRIQEGEQQIEKPGFNILAAVSASAALKDQLKSEQEQALADRADKIVTMMERNTFDDKGMFSILSKDERMLAQFLKEELTERGVSAGHYMKQEQMPDSLPYMGDKTPQQAKTSWQERVSLGGDLAKSQGISASQGM